MKEPMTKTKHKFEALSRMCLNNWHYIDRKILSFNQEINFFTGHSGSGKSTIIDAMQIVLYANTDGRGFFNKAAADDSDRSLIEYLRGMINIGDDNEFSYLRNENFSSTIVLELARTDTLECQCVGVAFDVNTTTNEIGRVFFWHNGPLLEHGYRTGQRCMSVSEIKTDLQQRFAKEAHFYTSHNERFRRQLYDVYLGGLDMEKFPLLFKRAIPFKMNIRLEDFVKEYICMEQDIHIEDMQESVMQYGRMRKKIEDTCKEIEELKDIHNWYQKVCEKEQERKKYSYFTEKLDILQLRERVAALQNKVILYTQDITGQKEQIVVLDREIEELGKTADEILKHISATGYEELKQQLISINELLERMGKSKARWDQTGLRLKEWVEQDMTSNSVIWDIEKFIKYEISEVELHHLQASVRDLMTEVTEQKQDLDMDIRALKTEQKKILEELKDLHHGRKSYPKELQDARQQLAYRLCEKAGKPVKVDILADLLDIRDEKWRNAVEGYMGNHKLAIIVEPAFAKEAMEIYQSLDKKKYYQAAVLDTEKMMQKEYRCKKGSLAEEVTAKECHVRAYINFLLGNVMKCTSVEELRESAIGITPECMLYQGFKLQHINPDNYTRWAYIGADSLRRRMKQLNKRSQELVKELDPRLETRRSYDRMLGMESLPNDVAEYLDWLADIRDCKAKEKGKKELELRIQKLREKDIASLEKNRNELLKLQKEKRRWRESIQKAMWKKQEEIVEGKRLHLNLGEELSWKEKNFPAEPAMDTEVQEYLKKKTNPNFEKLRDYFTGQVNTALRGQEECFRELCALRHQYLLHYPTRGFAHDREDNREYDELLERLKCDNLPKFMEIAGERARLATREFKNDFMLKIRSAIVEAMQRKDELNRIISRLDFGKDKYQFIFAKNKGPDGRFYDMFMDDSLEINPSDLSLSMENQMNLFTIAHENHYGELIGELISIFIPPENATPEEMEEAKRNMDKYADYRTYLSFDMQQTIQSENETIKIHLSKMLKKNSGGEGQNPLYVALLASFAQAYRFNLPPKIQRNPTIRLVILDEAFSKMDGEKVASCINLIRDLGFQVIISATNDKMQNYLENVDKTFVFANPNKKSISIQEFERVEFEQLSGELEGDS